MILLDTSVVSLVFREDPHARFYLPHMSGQVNAISFQTVEELLHGAYKKGWGPRLKSELDQHLEQYEVVWPDLETVGISANLRAERDRAGKPLDAPDAWIAATALRLSCPPRRGRWRFSRHPKPASDTAGRLLTTIGEAEAEAAAPA